MTPADAAPAAEPRSMDERMHRAERTLNIQGAHHEHLANQISELTVGIRELERRIPELMAQGIVAAVSSPATWEAAQNAMQARALNAAGGWLIGSLRFVVDKLLWACLALLAVYTLGGWPAIAAMLKLKAAS
ncbi:MAG: hypothetical protein ACR2JA_09045 [Hydrogenophaga sp.]|uniref:hypothetical protein n=1 Tax=Hydrogenophaga sp. TaxID=1904254 RepID=UPI003D9B16D9